LKRGEEEEKEMVLTRNLMGKALLLTPYLHAFFGARGRREKAHKTSRRGERPWKRTKAPGDKEGVREKKSPPRPWGKIRITSEGSFSG